MEGYANDRSGTGIKGEYFDNEAWIGKGKKRLDSRIYFDWKGASPLQGVNPYNFSIKWEGYLKAPYTGIYQFVVETTDSVMITLNNQVILAHNMKSASPESKSRNTIWLNNEVYLTQHPKITKVKSQSRDIYLLGGNKYKYINL
jgi:hypothetical protein